MEPVSWEVDFYRRPQVDAAGESFWELVIWAGAEDLGAGGSLVAAVTVVQSAASTAWLVEQLQGAAQAAGQTPDRLRTFRPQAVGPLGAAAERLGWRLEPTRHTPGLKAWLSDRAAREPWFDPASQRPYDPLALERPAPVPLPEALWGDRWRFAAIAAGELALALGPDRPIPVRNWPEAFLPERLGLADHVPIPGAVIDGGRRALTLARWLADVQPAGLEFMAGQPDGVILEAGLADRWVLTTFGDPQVRQAGQLFQARKAASQGVHFLLVRPDDSGTTYSGVWLLQSC